VESGYDTPPDRLVERVLDAGAVGINVEDTLHSQGRLREVAEHADYIGALRAAADQAGVELVINARTDAFMGRIVTFDDPLAEAVRRLQACEAAGARCVYPVRVPDAETLRSLLSEMSGPVNITAHPVDGAPSGSLEELQAAGVQRITFGPLLMAALTDKVTELVTPWR
jgi:2-methylisocitrate lyase-like PEP mutase family enzyme